MSFARAGFAGPDADTAPCSRIARNRMWYVDRVLNPAQKSLSRFYVTWKLVKKNKTEQLWGRT